MRSNVHPGQETGPSQEHTETNKCLLKYVNSTQKGPSPGGEPVTFSMSQQLKPRDRSATEITSHQCYDFWFLYLFNIS